MKIWHLLQTWVLATLNNNGHLCSTNETCIDRDNLGNYTFTRTIKNNLFQLTYLDGFRGCNPAPSFTTNKLEYTITSDTTITVDIILYNNDVGSNYIDNSNEYVISNAEKGQIHLLNNSSKNNGDKTYRFDVYDFEGNAVFSAQFPSSESSVTFVTKNITNGMYIGVIRCGDTMLYSQKIVCKSK